MKRRMTAAIVAVIVAAIGAAMAGCGGGGGGGGPTPTPRLEVKATRKPLAGGGEELHLRVENTGNFVARGVRLRLTPDGRAVVVTADGVGEQSVATGGAWVPPAMMGQEQIPDSVSLAGVPMGDIPPGGRTEGDFFVYVDPSRSAQTK